MGYQTHFATVISPTRSLRSFEMSDLFSDSTALVTGATAGIGRAVALQLADLGATVIVHGRNAERGNQVVAEIEDGGGKARLLTADLSDKDEARRLADAA